MSRTIFYTATTLDGFIAAPSDSLDWLLRQPLEEDGPGDYETFFAGVGALVMGSTTYEWVMQHERGVWPYELPTWVMTSRELEQPAAEGSAVCPDIRFASGPVAEVHAAMREAAGDKYIWVVGGGDLAGQFADAGLLDEVMTSIAPVVLGAGRQLLPRRLDLELLETGRNGAFITARHHVVGVLKEDVSDGAAGDVA